VAVPLLALSLVLVRHIVQGELYGDATSYEPAVLRESGQFSVRRPRMHVT
jgi:hypothetical protein